MVSLDFLKCSVSDLVNTRVALHIQPARYQAFFGIWYPSGYPVLFARYPAGRIASYKPDNRPEKLFWIKNRKQINKQTLVSESFRYEKKNKSELAIRSVASFVDTNCL